MGRGGQIREKDKCKGRFLSIHFPWAVAQQTQCLSETLVETSALPVIWTLTKTTNIFFFFKAVSCWSSYINLMALEEWLRSLSRQNKQQKYYFINRVLRMCFESTHHELITRWAEQSKRNSLDDKYQKGWFKKPSEMHSVSLLTQTTFSHFTLHGCAFCSVRFAWCFTGMRAWRCISNVNPC